jgi:hypothetical protein
VRQPPISLTAFYGFDLDRIRKHFPIAQSTKCFKLPRRRVYCLVGALCVWNVKLLLQAFELVPIGAEQFFEKGNAVA